MVLTRNEWFRNMRRNMGIYSRSLRKAMERQLVAKATGCFWFRARRKPAFVRGRNRKQTSGLWPQLLFHCLARTPREGTEMPQAQRRGISPFPQTAAHRHPLWATRTPIPMRQVPKSGFGAPQSSTYRVHGPFPCGCLAAVRKTSRNWRFSFAELDGKNHICRNEISFNQSLSKL